MTTAEAFREFNRGIQRARSAYYADRKAAEPQPPKTPRYIGLGIGICDRCGIDSAGLVSEKCSACRSYLYRKNRAPTPRECVVCDRPHVEPGRTCNTCRIRKYRAKVREDREAAR